MVVVICKVKLNWDVNVPDLVFLKIATIGLVDDFAGWLELVFWQPFSGCIRVLAVLLLWG